LILIKQKLAIIGVILALILISATIGYQHVFAVTVTVLKSKNKASASGFDNSLEQKAHRGLKALISCFTTCESQSN